MFNVTTWVSPLCIANYFIASYHIKMGCIICVDPREIMRFIKYTKLRRPELLASRQIKSSYVAMFLMI